MTKHSYPGKCAYCDALDLHKVLRTLASQMDALQTSKCNCSFKSKHRQKMEAQLVKNAQLEVKLEFRKQKLNKIAADLDMHYNIILGFAHSFQSLIGGPSDSIGSVKQVFMEELTVQQAQGDHAEESPVQHAPGSQQSEEAAMEEANTGHDFT